MPFYPISTLHAWNDRLVPVFGLLLNSLLFWLVWTKTPKEMQLHSRILLQTAIVDLAFACADFIGTAVVIYHGSISILLFDGYFVRILASLFNADHSTNYLIILYFISGACFLFDIYSICVQFVYRYLIFKRNIKITLANYLWMLTVPFFASLVVGISYILYFGEIIELNDGLKATLSANIDWEDSIYFIVQNNKLSFLGIFPVLAMIIAYSINIFFWKEVATFMSAHSGFNPRTKQLNQQLTKTLIILASFPLLSLLHTIVAFALIVLLKITGIQMLANIIMYEQFFALLIFPWVLAVNPIASIWINRPYRDAINKLINASLFFKKNSVTPVQTLNQ